MVAPEVGPLLLQQMWIRVLVLVIVLSAPMSLRLQIHKRIVLVQILVPLGHI